MQCKTLGLAMSFLATLATAQSPDGRDTRPTSEDPRVLLEYAQFDPKVSTPAVLPRLQAGSSVNLHIVQFVSSPTEEDREAIRRLGGVIKGFLPVDCHLVHMPAGAMGLYAIDSVRWVGPYQPAYRLEPFLLNEIATGVAMPTRIYNMVMADKRNDKERLAAKLQAIDSEIIDQHIGGLLFTASLNAQQLLQVAAMDEVLWIDRFSEPEYDMNNARIQGGANAIEAIAGYTGAGVRGHIYEGVEGTHPDFNTTIVQVGPGACSGANNHGHCTAGIVFGNGNSAPQARGMAPDAIGFFTRYVSATNATCATSPARNTIIGNAISNNNIMFTTASWGNARTFFYTSDSADADDIVFDHRIPWTQSQSNAGNQDSRPQAWGKNIISIGGVRHQNNSNPADDTWGNGGSTGPAQDSRSKPDLCAYYDSVWTSDLSGNAGYNTAAGVAGNSTTGFNGTSAATPIVAGHNAIAIQMYTDHLFTPPRVVGGSRFENRPYAQTLKALQIACANMYTPTPIDNRREHVGYGFPSLDNMYNRRDKISIIPEDVPITQGSTHTYHFDVTPNESVLKICMTYLDPAGNPAAFVDRINNLDLRVVSPSNVFYWGNNGLDGAGQTNQSSSGGAVDLWDTVENVIRNNPQAGTWTVHITAPSVTVDAHTATAATDATYALVVNGGRRIYGEDCARFLPDESTTAGSGNYYPWGGYTPTDMITLYSSNNGGAPGGAVYFDVVTTTPVWVHSIMVNTSLNAGEAACLDVHTKSGTYSGFELNAGAWTAKSAGRGISAGMDAQTQIDLAQPFRLAAGTHGFAITGSNVAHRYTNGNNTYTNGAVTINTGSASNIPFTGGVFTPRTANITLKFREATAQAQNMRYQTIMRSDELGAGGAITGLAFSGQSDGWHSNSNLKIRMSHVPAGYTLSTTFASNLPALQPVLESANHSWTYSDGEWANVGLQTPFNYNGTSDVVVEIVAKGNVQSTHGSGIGPFERDTNRQRVFNAYWDSPVPTSGTFNTSSALRMRAEFSCANANEYGASCGKLSASHSGSSALGSTFNYHVDGAAANSIAFIGLGENNSNPYPLSLTVVGFTNCMAFSQSIVTLSQATSPLGHSIFSLSVPNNPALMGYQLSGQWLGLDSSEPGGLTFSDVTRMTVGTTP
jgi:serine protease AprX